MKKRNLVAALLISVIILVTGCAKEEKVNPFLGTWNGTLDYTQCFTDMIVAKNADFQHFVGFENLTFTFVFTFTEENISVHIDDASKMQFVSNVEKGVAGMLDAMAEAEGKRFGITAEQVFERMDTTRDAYVEKFIKNMKFDTMVDAMVKALELNGAYEYDENKIAVLYDDNTYEEMTYIFGIEDLTIHISDGTNNFVIPCTKTE